MSFSKIILGLAAVVLSSTLLMANQGGGGNGGGIGGGYKLDDETLGKLHQKLMESCQQNLG